MHGKILFFRHRLSLVSFNTAYILGFFAKLKALYKNQDFFRKLKQESKPKTQKYGNYLPNLIRRFQKMHFLHLSLIVKSQQNRVKLVINTYISPDGCPWFEESL